MLKYEQLRAAQHQIADRIYEHDSSLIVLGMGGGKTAAALTAISELIRDGHIRQAIVLAPPLVAATVWDKEVTKWEHLRHLRVVPVIGTPKQRLKLLNEPADVFVFSLGVVKWLTDLLAKLPDGAPLLDFLGIDETSTLKDPRGTGSKALRKVAPRFKIKVGLTGTPRSNGYEDLWPQMQIITGDKLWPPFDDWRRRNFMPLDHNGYNWKIHDFREREILQQVAPYVTTIEDKDMPELPPFNAGPDYDTVVDLPAAAFEVYQKMETKLIAKVIANLRAEVRLDEELLIAALSQAIASSKLAQIAQGYLYDDGEAVSQLHDAKVDALRDMHASAGADPTIICYGYRQDLPLINRALGVASLPTLGGGTSPAQGRKIIQAFGRGEIERLVMHPASAGHGVDELKDNCRRMIWFCPTWSAEQYAQTVKRIDRPGQTRHTFSHQIVARRTVDEVKLNRVAYKLEDQSHFQRLVNEVRSGL